MSISFLDKKISFFKKTSENDVCKSTEIDNNSKFHYEYVPEEITDLKVNIISIDMVVFVNFLMLTRLP